MSKIVFIFTFETLEIFEHQICRVLQQDIPRLCSFLVYSKYLFLKVLGYLLGWVFARKIWEFTTPISVGTYYWAGHPPLANQIITAIRQATAKIRSTPRSLIMIDFGEETMK